MGSHKQKQCEKRFGTICLLWQSAKCAILLSLVWAFSVCSVTGTLQLSANMPNTQEVLRTIYMPFLYFRHTVIALPREHSFCNKLRKLQTLIRLVAKYFFRLRTVSWARGCLRTSWSVAKYIYCLSEYIGFSQIIIFPLKIQAKPSTQFELRTSRDLIINTMTFSISISKIYILESDISVQCAPESIGWRWIVIKR